MSHSSLKADIPRHSVDNLAVAGTLSMLRSKLDICTTECLSVMMQDVHTQSFMTHTDVTTTSGTHAFEMEYFRRMVYQ